MMATLPAAMTVDTSARAKAAHAMRLQAWAVFGFATLVRLPHCVAISWDAGSDLLSVTQSQLATKPATRHILPEHPMATLQCGGGSGGSCGCPSWWQDSA